jgi:tRNA (cmo5U34)-methyltransferase
MKETVNSFDKYYELVSEPIQYTEESIEILDLGCGTGLEIRGILKKAPNARITCIDMSENMMEILLENYRANRSQIRTINGSYLTCPFEERKYDYVVSVMTMHHFIYEEKVKLYEKVKKALKENGLYIEGDYIVEEEKAKELLEKYRNAYEKYGLEAAKLYHIDIPFSIETQKNIFKEAGFKQLELVFEEGEHTIYFAK